MNNGKLKVCLITPGHISTNPRLLKEASALQQAGYHVHLIFSQYISYWSLTDLQILDKHPSWTYEFLNWEGKTFKGMLFRYCSGIANKLAKIIFRRFGKAHSVALNRHYYWQLKASVRANAQLYIAHNLAALPIAVEAAGRVSGKCGFDAEDFHRYEESDDDFDVTVQLKKYIEHLYFPKLNYLTTASPLISKEYERLFNNIHPTSILNVFPRFEAQTNDRIESGEPVKLFWFSQWIGRGRGIEEVIRALGKLQEYPIELHLLGDSFGNDKEFFKNLLKTENLRANQVKFHSAIHPDELLTFASKFDIGLATEISKPFNRDICLTNKLFTYIQAGLTVIASDTSAQKLICKQYPSIGRTYKKENVEDLTRVIAEIISDRNYIESSRRAAREIGLRELNWEREQLKFLEVVKRLIANSQGE